MNFEEFCKYTELTKLNSDVSLSGREFMKIAWSHQQEKIDYWKREAIGDFSESKDFVRHINIAERQIKDLKEFYKELQAFCKELIEVVDYCVDNYSSDPLRAPGEDVEEHQSSNGDIYILSNKRAREMQQTEMYKKFKAEK